MNFDERLTITLLDKGLLALLVVVAVFGLNSLLERQKAKAGLKEALASKRAEVYGELWSKTQRLGFANKERLHPNRRESLFQELTDWYYNQNGALHLSHAATKQFLLAREQLRRDDVDDDAVRDTFSTLRTQLKRDCGIYTWLEAKRSVVPRLEEDGAHPEPEPLADARSIRDAMGRMVRSASDATERLNARIENKDLGGRAEAEELREALERVQSLSLEVREELDAYQQRHAR